jgi:capsular exopolysaccharide synthesis family protein
MKVILVDADLRRPVQHEIFNLSNQEGLSNLILSANSKPDQHLQSTDIENLLIFTSGSLPPDPSKLLGSERMKEIIEQLKAEADIVLFDSPPVLAVADALILAPLVEGVILVNDVGRTRISDARRAIEEMLRVQSNLLGIVLNRVPVNGSTYYYYHYKTGAKAENENVNGSHRDGWLEKGFIRRLLGVRPEREK